MAVKGNQPWLWWEVTTLFSDVALIRESGTTALTVDKGHGRLERRQVWTSSALAGCSTWPHLAQAVCLEREVVLLATGELRRERAYAVTSVAAERADAQAILGWWRGHWGIENRLHWVRDLTFGEDRSPAWVAGVPEMLAALRNTVIGVLRLHGYDALAATRRHLARHPERCFTLIGLRE